MKRKKINSKDHVDDDDDQFDNNDDYQQTFTEPKKMNRMNECYVHFLECFFFAHIHTNTLIIDLQS